MTGTMAVALLGSMTLPAMASVTLRNTGIQSSSANSYTVSWPSGTVAGDMAIIMAGHGFGVNLPSGWTQLDNSTGANWNGAAFFRILTSGDISTGHVTVTTAGTFNGVIAIATIETGTFEPTADPTIFVQRNGTGSSSISLTGFCYETSDLALYFGSNRAASTNTVNIGSSQQAINASNASGMLYTQNPSSTAPNPTFSYGTSGSGNYQAVICVKIPNTVPSWIRGTGIQSGNASTITVSWPSGTVAGDTAVIFNGECGTSTPSGWTQLNSSSSGQVYTKVLSSGDITTGSVSISVTSGPQPFVTAIATIIASSLNNYSAPTATMLGTAAGGTNTHTVNYTSQHTTDYALYFATGNITSGNMYASVSLGNFQTSLGPVSGQSGALYAGSPASVGTISPVFSYAGTTATNADYQGTALFTGPNAAKSKAFMHSFPP